MDFFDDLRGDEPFDDEHLDEFDSESGEDDEAVDELSSAELEFVELPDKPVPPVEMPLSSIEWPSATGAAFEPGLQPVPMPGARDPAFDFSMLVGPGFDDGFAEIPRPKQPRGMPFSPQPDLSGHTQRRHYDLLFRKGDPRSGIELLPYRPDRDRPHSMVLASDTKDEHDSSGDLATQPVVASSPTPGDFKPLGQPRPTALVQLLDYDQLFLKEQRAFETRLAEVAKEIAKREVDHASWVDYIHYRAAFGTR